MERGAVNVKGLVSEAMPVEELPRGLEMMKKGSAPMKLQVVFRLARRPGEGRREPLVALARST